MNQQPVIALTGASGQIGSWILRYALEAGYSDIRCLSRESRPVAEGSGVKWFRGDITDLFTLDDFMEGVDVLIHAAGLVSYRDRDERLLTDVNIRGTANLVNLALQNKVGHMIHMSSSATLGRDMTNGPINESSVWIPDAPSSVYAASKYEAELEVWRGMEEGLGISILNPVIVLDPDCRGRSTRVFVDAVHRGIRSYPTGSHGFVDVRDIARAVLARVRQGPTGQRLLLSGGNATYREVLVGLASAMGRGIPTHAVSLKRALWMNRVARWLGKQALADNEVRMAFDQLLFDTSRAREGQDLDVIPLADTLQAIARTTRSDD